MKLTSSLAIGALATSSLALNSSQPTNSSYATFVYNSTIDQTQGNTLIWSMNAVQSTGDVYFHLEAPWSGSWVAVGFGTSMPGSLMMVAYPSSNGTGMTVSPRIATGYSEPAYTPDKKVDLIWDSQLKMPNSIDQNNAIMYVDAVCRNCTTWNGGSLDLKSNAAPFIYAVGPMGYIADDSPSAPLTRHDYFGSFSFDMTVATSANNGSVPNPSSFSNKGVAAIGTPESDGNWREHAHAGMMIFAWLIVFPLGSLLLRLFNKVIMHAIFQGIGFVFIFIAFTLGIYISKYYLRSQSFTSAHQVIGIVLMIGLFVQLGLGIVGHRIFKKTNQKSKLAKVHVALGAVLILGAVVNGGLGLTLSQNGFAWSRYLILVVAIFIIFAGLRIIGHRCARRRQQARLNQGGPGVGPDGYQYPQFVAPKEPHAQSVPLTDYNRSQESIPHYAAAGGFAGPAQQPRQMV